MLTAKIPERQTIHMFLGAPENVTFSINSIPNFIFSFLLNVLERKEIHDLSQNCLSTGQRYCESQIPGK
jgi:hypothetical protein